MANQSVQPVQIKSTPGNLYTTYNRCQFNSGFATVQTVQKKEKASISSIFNWKKDKVREKSPTLFHNQSATFQASAYPVHYAPSPPNYIIDSNQKFMHYNSIYKPDHRTATGYLEFPSTIHATIRYLPNHKQRTNILTTNWEPATAITYPTHPNAYHLHNSYSSANQQQQSSPITLQHEITYSEQITIAPSPCLTHHHNCQPCLSKCQSCKCTLNENKNYYLIPTTANSSSLLDSSIKSYNKSTDCMLSISKKKGLMQSNSKHSSIRGSKSHHNLNLDDSQMKAKKKGGSSSANKLAATVNERFLRIFKRSIKEPFNSVKSRKSILDCDLTAYDLVEKEEDLKENDELNSCKKLNIQKTTHTANQINLDSSIEEEAELEVEEDEPDQFKNNQFESNFMQAKQKQKQHYYSPFKKEPQQQQVNQNRKEEETDTTTLASSDKLKASTKNCTNSLNFQNNNNDNKNKNSNRKDKTTTNKDEEDRWPNSFASQAASSQQNNLKTKFNSWTRIAGQGMQLTKLSKRMSILESDLSKEFLKEELSEDEDLNRFDKYNQNFEQIMSDSKSTKSTKLNNELNNFRLFSSSSSLAHQNHPNDSIPNLPEPDYDSDRGEAQKEDEEDDRHTLTMLSRSTPDLDQTANCLDNVKRTKRSTSTFTNTTSLFNLDSSSTFKERPPYLQPPLPPLPTARLSQFNNNNVQKSNQTNNNNAIQPSSPSSSTYSSFSSSINSNVKSILKKSNSNLVILEHLKSVDLFNGGRRKESNFNFNSNLTKNSQINENKLLSKRCTSNKSVSTFKGNNYQKRLEELKPKKQVHFTRSSLNDELIVEHIDTKYDSQQELIEEEQIYDDIQTARLKQTNDGSGEENSANEKKEAKIEINLQPNKENKNNAYESKNFLKFDNLEKKYSNQSPEENLSIKSSDSGEYFDTLLSTDKDNKQQTNNKESASFLHTGKIWLFIFLNSIV